MRNITIVLVLCSILRNGYSCDDTLNLNSILNIFNKIEINNQQINFDAVVYTTDFGETIPQVKKYKVGWNENFNNTLHGIDYYFEELIGKDSSFIMASRDTNLFGVFTPNKVMTRSKLPVLMDPGFYFQTLVDRFYFHHILDPFQFHSNRILWQDSMNLLQIKLQMSPTNYREILIDTSLNLIIQSKIVSKSRDFNLQMIEEILFNYSQESSIKRAPSITVSDYLADGYIINEITNSSSNSMTLEIDSVFIHNILNYCFLTEYDDTVKLIDIKDQYILLDFWYASCAPCLKAIPDLIKVDEQFRTKDLKIVGINCFDTGVKSVISSKLKEKGVTFELLYGERKLITSLSLKYFPAYFIVTPERDIIELRNTEEIATFLENNLH